MLNTTIKLVIRSKAFSSMVPSSTDTEGYKYKITHDALDIRKV